MNQNHRLLWSHNVQARPALRAPSHSAGGPLGRLAAPSKEKEESRSHIPLLMENPLKCLQKDPAHQSHQDDDLAIPNGPAPLDRGHELRPVKAGNPLEDTVCFL